MKRPENNGTKRAYPIMPYLIGLFVTVIVLVLFSYLMQLRNKQELSTNETGSSCIVACAQISA